MVPATAAAFTRASVITCIFLCFLCAPSIGATGLQQETAEQFVERVKKAIANDEWGRAKSGLKHALVLKPGSAESHFLSAQVYLHEGSRSMAIDSLQRAIQYQPVYPDAHFLLAQCLIEAGTPDKAREEVNIAITQGISPFPGYRLLAETYLAEGDFEAAVASLETALYFASTVDDGAAARLRAQIEGLRAVVEWQNRFGVISAVQKAPDIVRPVPLNSPYPTYTEEARRLRVQGAISMILLVTESGNVESVLIFRGLGHGLDEQASAVAHKLRFSPATKSGRPIPYWQKLSVEFWLR